MISDLFREAVKGVKPLDQKHRQRVTLFKQKNLKPNRQLPSENQNTVKILEENHIGVMASETIFFAQATLQQKTIKKLRQGKIYIAATLDLHSLTVDEARQELENFLSECQKKDLRSVLIIHGKGLAIIKSAINTWLRNYSNTLAFCSAQPKDGGTGAVYLLLKKNKSY